jgi:predicted amidohydrolase YtcJ
LDLSGVKSYSNLHEILQQECKSREPTECIVGLDLMEDCFTNPSEQRFPNRYDLDSLCPMNPCIILRHDGHICALNSAALDLIGINEKTVKKRAIESGEIRVDSKGVPTGIFTEEATAIALDALSIPSNERLRAACIEFSNELASLGITTCGGVVQAGNIGVEGNAGALVIPMLETFIKEDLILQDYVFYITTNRPRVLNRYKKSFQKLSKEEKRFEVGGIKIYADGSFGASTACMFEPFSDSSMGAKGFMVTKREDMYNLFKETYDLGFHIACHAIGDQANRIVIDVFNDVIKDSARSQSRCRIEHASILTDDMLADASKLGLIMVCQPAFINSEYTWLEKRLGPKRVKNTYPFKSIIDAGVTLAGASDAPIESASVFEAIRACVTRNGLVIEQCISVQEALKMFTINAAYALGQEMEKGSLEKGKFADFVVLNKCIESISPINLSDIKIIATYHRGNRIYLAK